MNVSCMTGYYYMYEGCRKHFASVEAIEEFYSQLKGVEGMAYPASTLPMPLCMIQIKQFVSRPINFVGSCDITLKLLNINCSLCYLPSMQLNKDSIGDADLY